MRMLCGIARALTVGACVLCLAGCGAAKKTRTEDAAEVMRQLTPEARSADRVTTAETNVKPLSLYLSDMNTEASVEPIKELPGKTETSAPSGETTRNDGKTETTAKKAADAVPADAKSDGKTKKSASDGKSDAKTAKKANESKTDTVPDDGKASVQARENGSADAAYAATGVITAAALTDASENMPREGAEEDITRTVVPEIAAETPGETVEKETPTPDESREVTYVLNASSKKFHLPTCPSVKDIKQGNRVDSHDTREEIVNSGYDPCKRCKP